MENNRNLKIEKAIIIQSDPGRVWKTLTEPNKIKQFMFGSDIQTDWQTESPVTFTRQDHGKIWRDKGRILEFAKEKKLQFSYWSSQEGYADIPENYTVITYILKRINQSVTELTFRREHIPIEIEKINQEKYLPGMMEKIKMLSEEIK